MAPEYKLYSGTWISISFFYILAFYGVLFFTEHSSDEMRQRAGGAFKASNHNETHYAAVVLGLGLGAIFRRRFGKNMGQFR